MKNKLIKVAAFAATMFCMGSVMGVSAEIDRNATFTTWDGYTHDTCGDVYDQWGNMVYDSPACLIDAGYDPFEGLQGTLNGSWDNSTWQEPAQNDVIYTNEESITIGNYSASLQYCMDQWVVDQDGVAVYLDMGGKTVIADHRYQGFDIIENTPVGTTATVNMYGQQYTLTKASQYSGYNIKTGLQLADGRDAYSVEDGWVLMYTCQKGSSGYNITVTYWN